MVVAAPDLAPAKVDFDKVEIAARAGMLKEILANHVEVPIPSVLVDASTRRFSAMLVEGRAI